MRHSRFAGEVSGLALERTVVRLTALAVARGGTVAVADVEEDEQPAAEPTADRAHSFPYGRLTFLRMSDETGDGE